MTLRAIHDFGHWLGALLTRFADFLLPPEPPEPPECCLRCGQPFVYLGYAPICLTCDKPGDYLRENRKLRDT